MELGSASSRAQLRDVSLLRVGIGFFGSLKSVFSSVMVRSNLSLPLPAGALCERRDAARSAELMGSASSGLRPLRALTLPAAWMRGVRWVARRCYLILLQGSVRVTTLSLSQRPPPYAAFSKGAHARRLF